MRYGVMVLVLAAALAGCTTETQECGGPGIACLYAGTGELRLGAEGKPPTETAFYWVMDTEFAPDGTPYILDFNNHRVRRITSDGVMETVIGDFVGDGPPDQSDLTTGAPGLTVNLNHPTDIQFDAEGRLVLCSWHNHKIRLWDPNTDVTTVMAGRGGGFRGEGTDAAMALFNSPRSIAYGPGGDLFILDQRNFRIRKISTDGMITTVAGTGVSGFGGDEGPALMAELAFETGAAPQPSGGMTVDADGVIYLADTLNNRIRKVTTDGVIHTIAGTGEAGVSGDAGDAIAAQLNGPQDIELSNGKLYIADTENDRIRALDLATGTITTVAGTGEQGKGEPGQLATETALYRPFGVAFDAEGTLYISDTYNSRVLRVRLGE